MQVGFVGAVTEELPALVSPAGIADIQVDPIVESVNTEAAALVAGRRRPRRHARARGRALDGLRHDGRLRHLGRHHQQRLARRRRDRLRAHAPGVQLLVPRAGRGSTRVARSPIAPSSRPVSTGRTSTSSSTPSMARRATVRRRRRRSSRSSRPAAYPADPAVTALVDAGEAAGGRARRAFRSATDRRRLQPRAGARRDGARTDYRGGESTLGNLVAEVQQWATEQPESGAAEIAFMNPGGLRADMDGSRPGRRIIPAHRHVRQAAARAAVRQHAREHAAHGRADQDGARAAVAAGRIQLPADASVPASRGRRRDSSTPTRRRS